VIKAANVMENTAKILSEIKKNFFIAMPFQLGTWRQRVAASRGASLDQYIALRTKAHSLYLFFTG
jgi:hypothetical protein